MEETKHMDDIECDDNMEGWEEDFEECVTCPFCTETFKGCAAALEHCTLRHGLDMLGVKSRLGLDMYGWIRFVNYVRSEAARLPADSAVSTICSALEGASSSSNPFTDDKYLQPFLSADDPLLFGLDDMDDDEDECEEMGGGSKKAGESVTAATVAPAPQPVQQQTPPPELAVSSSEDATTAALRRQVAALQSQLEQSQRTSFNLSCTLKATTELFKNVAVGGEVTKQEGAGGDKGEQDGEQDNDSYYFDSYSDFSIHETMLRDDVRTRSYMEALEALAPQLKGKTVLDVGCGTGVLCMFAARCGASRVIGVDCSHMAHTARRLVAANGYDDVITIVKGKVEEVELPVDQVDVIVSEWMGYCLLFEAMLDSVLVARRRWLRPGGLILPRRSQIKLQAVGDWGGRWAYWGDVYGLDFRSVRPLLFGTGPGAPASRLTTAAETAITAAETAAGTPPAAAAAAAAAAARALPTWAEPLVEVVSNGAVRSNTALLLDVDCASVEAGELDFETQFELTITEGEAGSSSSSSSSEGWVPVCGLLAWFDIDFDHGVAPEKVVTFSTGPHATPTHWKQTLFYLPAPVHARPGDRVTGQFKLRRHHVNPRELDVEIHWRLARDGEGAVEAEAKGAEYELKDEEGVLSPWRAEGQERYHMQA